MFAIKLQGPLRLAAAQVTVVDGLPEQRPAVVAAAAAVQPCFVILTYFQISHLHALNKCANTNSFLHFFTWCGNK